MAVKFHRLPSGDWGLKFEGETPVPGSQAKVVTRSGRSARVTVGEIIDREANGAVITAISRAGTPSKEEKKQMPIPQSGTYRRCKKCGTRKPIEQFRPYGGRGQHRWTCRECEGFGPAPTRDAASRPIGYPLTKYCPNGHGSVIFDTPDEEALHGGCAVCGEELTYTQPKPKEAVSTFKNLPANLPEVRHEVFEKVLSAVGSGRHVYLAGPPGTGKSMIGSQVAEVLERAFYAPSLDSTQSSSAFKGFVRPDGEVVRTAFREAFENGGVFQIDEMDNGHPNVLAVLNEALSNGRFQFPDAMITAHPEFVVIATANTWGNGPNSDFVGRLKIDPATLDRFVRVFVPIDQKLEEAVTLSAAGGDKSITKEALGMVRKLRKKLDQQRVKLFVTPRASMQVAALMVEGWTLKDAVMTTAVGTLEPERVAELMQ